LIYTDKYVNSQCGAIDTYAYKKYVSIYTCDDINIRDVISVLYNKKQIWLIYMKDIYNNYFRTNMNKKFMMRLTPYSYIRVKIDNTHVSFPITFHIHYIIMFIQSIRKMKVDIMLNT
jgi:hypothetical protein